MTKKILILLFFSFSIFVSSCVEDSSKNVEYPGFKAVSIAMLCPSTPTNVANDDVFISFEDESFRPKPNTWYKTDFNIWYKTGSDVSIVNAPVSFEVQTTGYTSHCSK
jgi:hypothetical protein